MFDLVFGNAHYKAAALAAAIAAWLYVQSDEVHPAPIKASIDWTLADGLVGVDALPTHIMLQIEGTHAAIRRARRAEIQVIADIQNIGAGQHALEFAPMPVTGLPSGVEIRGYAPSGIRFSLDRIGDRRVEVQPQVVGSPEAGFAVGKVTVSPAVVRIRGARSKIDQLTTVQTEPIDVSGLDRGSALPVQLSLPQGVEPAERFDLEATVEVLALNEQRTFGDVPVHIWGGGPGVPSVRTAQVVLRGPAATLRKLSPEDVTVFLHLNGNAPVRMRVLHAGGDEIQVTSVRPDVFTVSR